MDDEIEQMLIEVRAGTDGFAADVAQMRAVVDGNLVAGFTRAGEVLERGLASAVRRGSLGFEDLRRSATAALDAIAQQAVGTLVGAALPAGDASGGAGAVVGLLSGLLGLPGRATGGNVAPGRGYVVGERGPELFVPTSAGRIEPAGDSRAPRDVRVGIRIAAPRGSDVPRSLQRSARQVAVAVRRALAD